MDRKVLLVADDDEMNRTVISKFLGTRFKVLEASDGKITMDILNEEKVDMLLLDIIMPELNGLEILELLQKEKKNPYLGILVATSAKEKTERQALSLGADDIVSKPYDPIVIHKRLDNILAIKDAQREKDDLVNNRVDIQEIMLEREENRAVEAVKRLHMLSDMIEYNKESPELLAEVANSVHLEADKIMAIFEDR